MRCFAAGAGTGVGESSGMAGSGQASTAAQRAQSPSSFTAGS